MSLYLKQQDTRSDLQKQIAKELQEKAKRKAAEAELPDGVDDSRYIEGTRKTTSLAWLWLILAVIVIGVVVWLLVSTAQ